MMKKVCVFLGVLLLLSAATSAAGSVVEGKKFEFSTAFSFESIKFGTGTDWYKVSFFNVPVRLGYFIWKGLEFEPELMLTAQHESYSGGYTYNQTGWLLSGNLLYNFKLNKSPRLLPFILAGFGFGNGVPYAGYVEKYDVGAKATFPNLGVGLKYLFGNIAALRLEYRYRHERIKVTSEGTYVEKVTLNGLFLGLSLFF
ncbi:MAG: outer membrane beta-barrel protein [Candidatus Aminicenantales bacterium]|jgi:opacity protein-like surface antigen